MGVVLVWSGPCSPASPFSPGLFSGSAVLRVSGRTRRLYGHQRDAALCGGSVEGAGVSLGEFSFLPHGLIHSTPTHSQSGTLLVGLMIITVWCCTSLLTFTLFLCNSETLASIKSAELLRDFVQASEAETQIVCFQRLLPWLVFPQQWLCHLSVSPSFLSTVLLPSCWPFLKCFLPSGFLPELRLPTSFLPPCFYLFVFVMNK